jgi:mRNA interferase MazF
MTGYEFGDIVLIPFPFTDQSSTKRRPAVIISSAAYHRSRHDVLVMAITSQRNPVTGFGEVAVQDWQSAGLLKPSAIKPVLTTIDPKLVIKRLGRLSSADQTALRQALATLLG